MDPSSADGATTTSSPTRTARRRSQEKVGDAQLTATDQEIVRLCAAALFSHTMPDRIVLRVATILGISEEQVRARENSVRDKIIAGADITPAVSGTSWKQSLTEAGRTIPHHRIEIHIGDKSLNVPVLREKEWWILNHFRRYRKLNLKALAKEHGMPRTEAETIIHDLLAMNLLMRSHDENGVMTMALTEDLPGLADIEPIQTGSYLFRPRPEWVARQLKTADKTPRFEGLELYTDRNPNLVDDYLEAQAEAWEGIQENMRLGASAAMDLVSHLHQPSFADEGKVDKARVVEWGNIISHSLLSAHGFSNKSRDANAKFAIARPPALELAQMIMASFQNNDRQSSLKEIFAALNELPDGEIERLRLLIDGRRDFWEGIVWPAPELYQDRKASERLPDFIRRVYKEPGHLTETFTTAHFDVLDYKLAAAIRQWRRTRPLPSDIDIPTKYVSGESRNRISVQVSRSSQKRQ